MSYTVRFPEEARYLCSECHTPSSESFGSRIFIISPQHPGPGQLTKHSPTQWLHGEVPQGVKRPGSESDLVKALCYKPEGRGFATR
jgi:hypothetical protein